MDESNIHSDRETPPSSPRPLSQNDSKRVVSISEEELMNIMNHGDIGSLFNDEAKASSDPFIDQPCRPYNGNFIDIDYSKTLELFNPRTGKRITRCLNLTEQKIKPRKLTFTK